LQGCAEHHVIVIAVVRTSANAAHPWITTQLHKQQPKITDNSLRTENNITMPSLSAHRRLMITASSRPQEWHTQASPHATRTSLRQNLDASAQNHRQFAPHRQQPQDAHSFGTKEVPWPHHPQPAKNTPHTLADQPHARVLDPTSHAKPKITNNSLPTASNGTTPSPSVHTSITTIALPITTAFPGLK